MIKRRNLDLKLGEIEVAKPADDGLILIQEHDKPSELKVKKSECETVHIPCAADNFQSEISGSNAKMRSAFQSIQDFSRIQETDYIPRVQDSQIRLLDQ